MPFFTAFPVPLLAEFVHTVLHPLEQGFRIRGRNPEPLELEDFPLLPVALAAPVGDVLAEVVEVHCIT